MSELAAVPQGPEIPEALEAFDGAVREATAGQVQPGMVFEMLGALYEVQSARFQGRVVMKKLDPKKHSKQ